MKIEDAKNRYLFKTEIFLKDYNGEQTEDKVIIREPNMREMQKVQAAKEDEQQSVILSILPNCILETTIQKENGQYMSGKEFVDFISESVTTTTSLIEDWLNVCPFVLRQKNKEK